jgi:hypothetical protein
MIHASRTTLALCVVATIALAIPSGRADSTAPGASSAASAPTIEELRSRFTGLYRYVGDAAEQQKRIDAIDRSVASLFFAVRSMARAKIEDRTRIMPTCKFEFGDGQIRSTVPGHAVAISPESGAPAPYRVDDDAIVLTQRFDGARIVQVFRADEGGTRKNEFSLSPDGKILSVKATLSSPKLSVPVVYTLTYRRAE